MNSIDTAYAFYSRHIYDEEKMDLLSSHGLKIAGSVPSVIWELFGSLLTERLGRDSNGADLQGWEVKSAVDQSSFEYQYHLNTGAEKLKEDCKINHLFCSYSKSYKDVIVKVIRGSDLAKVYFNKWEPDYFSNYNASVPRGQRRQRFRRAVSFSHVHKNGTLVLKIQNTELIYSDHRVIPRFNKK